MSEWLLFNANLAFFNLYHKEINNQLQLNLSEQTLDHWLSAKPKYVSLKWRWSVVSLVRKKGSFGRQCVVLFWFCVFVCLFIWLFLCVFLSFLFFFLFWFCFVFVLCYCFCYICFVLFFVLLLFLFFVHYNAKSPILPCYFQHLYWM